MIVGDLKCSSRIESLHPMFKTAFDYVKSHDLLAKEPGRIELDGDVLFINRSTVKGVRQEDQVLELHRDYIDIHILLDGNERIGWKPLESCKNLKQAYDPAGDCMLYDEPAESYVDLRPGQFLIAYPEDAHAPIIGNGTIQKLIVKVKL